MRLRSLTGRCALLGVLVAWIAGTGPLGAAGPAIHRVDYSPSPIATFDTLQIAVQLSTDFHNPFDPRAITLDARFYTPSGREIVRPGFIASVDAVPGKRNSNPSHWLIRFASDEPGLHAFVIELRDRNGFVRSPEYAVEVVPGPHPGYVEIHPEDPFRFRYSGSGEPFIPVGHNLGWSWLPRLSDNLLEMEVWLSQLVFSGAVGTAMMWFWDNYVHPNAFYRTYQPLVRFIEQFWSLSPQWIPIARDPEPGMEREPGQSPGQELGQAATRGLRRVGEPGMGKTTGLFAGRIPHDHVGHPARASAARDPGGGSRRPHWHHLR